MSVLYRHKSRVEKRLHQIWEIYWEGVRRIGNTWLFIRTVKQLFTIPGHQGMQGAWARYPRPDFFLPLSPACKWKRRLGRFSGSRKTGTTGWTRCKSSEGSCSRLDDTLPKNLTIILLKLTLYLLQSPKYYLTGYIFPAACIDTKEYVWNDFAVKKNVDIARRVERANIVLANLKGSLEAVKSRLDWDCKEKFFITENHVLSRHLT